MTTPAKLVTTTASSDLKKYEDMDVDQLLSQLSAEEIQMLAKEVDPDVSTVVLRLIVSFYWHLCSSRPWVFTLETMNPSIRVSALIHCERCVKVLHFLLQWNTASSVDIIYKKLRSVYRFMHIVLSVSILKPFRKLYRQIKFEFWTY